MYITITIPHTSIIFVSSVLYIISFALKSIVVFFTLQYFLVITIVVCVYSFSALHTIILALIIFIKVYHYHVSFHNYFIRLITRQGVVSIAFILSKALSWIPDLYYNLNIVMCRIWVMLKIYYIIHTGTLVFSIINNVIENALVQCPK